jgi:hypothetical protein
MGRAAPGPALTAANLEFLKELRMKAKITYKYDQEGQKRSLMAGGDGKADQVMEVEVSGHDLPRARAGDPRRHGRASKQGHQTVSDVAAASHILQPGSHRRGPLYPEMVPLQASGGSSGDGSISLTTSNA